jgi:hypothetical protein
MSGADFGKLKSMVGTYNLKPVEIAEGSSVVKDLRSMLQRFNITAESNRSNKTETNNTNYTEPLPKSEMKTDYDSGPNKTSGGMTNGTFTTDSGPFKEEAAGPEVEKTNETDAVDFPTDGSHESEVLDFIRRNPEVFVALAMGVGGLALGGVGAPVLGAAGAELATGIGTMAWNGAVAGGAGAVAGDVADRVCSWCGRCCKFWRSYSSWWYNSS